jgi:hypothetical protein
MNKLFTTTIGAITLLLIAVPCSRAEKCVPLGTKKLLSLLPASPPSLDNLAPWKLTVSRGRQDIEVDWITTTAERTYLQDLEDAETRAATVSIRVVDTGMYPLPMQMFGPDPVSNPRRDLEIQGHPAMKRGADPGYMRMVILISSRFLVDVQANEISPADFDRLLAALPLGPLSTAPKIPGETLPSEITLTIIDELRPEGNSVRNSFFQSQEARRSAEESHAKFMEQAKEDYFESGTTPVGMPATSVPPPE